MSAAKQSFDKAISLNGEYFYNFVQRGKIFESQRNTKAAQADYARSLSLLPTATAQLGLGRFAEQQGKTQVARRFYSMAAQAGNSEGNIARQALLKLQPDAKTNKDTSLLVRQGLTRQGTFAIEVINQTSAALGNVRLGVTMPNGPQRVLSISQVIQPGTRRIIQTGQKLTKAQANRVKIVVLNADPAR